MIHDEPELDVMRRALDAIDVGVVVFTKNLGKVLHVNAPARELLPSIPPWLLDMAKSYIASREDTRRNPPVVRVELEKEAAYMRLVASAGEPPLELMLIRQEVIRDPELFRLLNARYGVSRREFQVLSSLRLGKTNQQIATDLGLAAGTIAQHIHRLLERFEVPNRTRLVSVLEALAPRK